MTNSLRLDDGETQAPRSKSQECITGNSQTLHDLNHSLCEYVMRLRCDKGANSPTLGGGLVAAMSATLG